MSAWTTAYEAAAAQWRALQQRHWPSGLPREPEYPLGMVPLTQYLRHWAQHAPNVPAVWFYGRPLTFAELDALSDRFAHLLRERGLMPGDRVAVMLPNCPQFHIAFYGILKAGCVHVPVNPMYRALELEHVLADSEPRLMVAMTSLQSLLQAVVEKGDPQLIWTRVADFLPADPAIPVPAALRDEPPSPQEADLLRALHAMPATPFPMADDLDAPAALNYTGGTTGLPKGCIHTQRDMVYTAACAATFMTGRADDAVGLTYVPIFWIAGENNGLLHPVFSGRPTVLLTRWDAEAVLTAIRHHRVTHLLGVMDNLVELLDLAERAGRVEDLASIRSVLGMSFIKKVSVAERRRWQALVGAHVMLREAAYGMTETHTGDTITLGFQENDGDLTGEPVFVGLPMPGTDIVIVDFETRQPLPLGEAGEIVIRTPSLCKGYWRRPEETAAAIVDGWMHTGDIGRLDERGCLHYLGRRKEMLKVKGVSVFPAEIEVLLSRHPAVRKCAVIGRSDADKGEVPVAFVELDPVLRHQWDEASIAAWCRAEMSPHKVPEVRVVDALPLTTTGKVQKEKLREWLPS